MRKKLKRIAIGLVILVIVVSAGVLTTLWVLGGGKPNIAVDYVAIFNENAAAVPEEDRAWQLYLELVPDLVEFSDWGYRSQLKDIEPGSERWTNLISLVEKKQTILDRIREASLKPGLGFISTRVNEQNYMIAKGAEPNSRTIFNPSHHSVFDINLPYLRDLPTMASALSVDSRVALAGGDGERLPMNIRAQLDLSKHSGESRSIINQLTEIRIRENAFQDIEWAIRNFPDSFTASDLDSLKTLIAGIDNGGIYKIDMAVERNVFYDLAQRIFTDSGNGDGHICKETFRYRRFMEYKDTPATDTPIIGRIRVGFFRLFSSSRAEIVSAYDEYFDRIDTRLERPRRDWNGPPASDLYNINFSYDETDGVHDLGLEILSSMTPVFHSIYTMADSINLRKDATIVAIALEQYRRTLGDWPGSLDELVPNFMDSIPADPFDDGPLKYQVGADGPVIYSIGTDRNDDGGRASKYAKNWNTVEKSAELEKQTPEVYDGDWVVYPAPDFN